MDHLPLQYGQQPQQYVSGAVASELKQTREQLQAQSQHNEVLQKTIQTMKAALDQQQTPQGRRLSNVPSVVSMNFKSNDVTPVLAPGNWQVGGRPPVLTPVDGPTQPPAHTPRQHLAVPAPTPCDFPTPPQVKTPLSAEWLPAPAPAKVPEQVVPAGQPSPRTQMTLDMLRAMCPPGVSYDALLKHASKLAEDAKRQQPGKVDVPSALPSADTSVPPFLPRAEEDEEDDLPTHFSANMVGNDVTRTDLMQRLMKDLRSNHQQQPQQMHQFMGQQQQHQQQAHLPQVVPVPVQMPMAQAAPRVSAAPPPPPPPPQAYQQQQQHEQQLLLLQHQQRQLQQQQQPLVAPPPVPRALPPPPPALCVRPAQPHAASPQGALLPRVSPPRPPAPAEAEDPWGPGDVVDLSRRLAHDLRARPPSPPPLPNAGMIVNALNRGPDAHAAYPAQPPQLHSRLEEYQKAAESILASAAQTDTHRPDIWSEIQLP